MSDDEVIHEVTHLIARGAWVVEKSFESSGSIAGKIDAVLNNCLKAPKGSNTFASFGASSPLEPSGPTVVCNGKGGYRVDMQGKESLIFGACLRAHEESHIEDLKKICPDGCKGKKNGDAHPTDSKGCPGFATVDYDYWRKLSECKAYKVELACLRKLFQTATDTDKGTIRARIKSAKTSLKYWKCPDD